MDTVAKHNAEVCFRISGEPFDIPMSQLRAHPESMLLAVATQAAGGSRRERGRPLVELPRDVRAFRVIRRFLESGALQAPADELDLALLRDEASFYGLTAVLRILADLTEEPVGPGAGYGRLASLVAPAAPTFVAPAAARETAAAEPGLPDFWRKAAGPPALDPAVEAALEPEDEAMQAAELEARLAFGANENGTKLVPAVALFGVDGACPGVGVDPRPPAYARLVWPRQAAAGRAQRRTRPRRVFHAARLVPEGIEIAEHIVGGDGDEAGEEGMGEPEFEAGDAVAHRVYGAADLEDAAPRGAHDASEPRPTPEPGVEPEPEYVSSFNEFSEQMHALTLGVLGDVLTDGPFVVAGGAVLACLRRWPATPVPEASLADWPNAPPELATKFAAELLEMHGQARNFRGGYMAAAMAHGQMMAQARAQPAPGSREAMLMARLAELEQLVRGAGWAPPPAPEPPRMRPEAARYLGLAAMMAGCRVKSAGPGSPAWVEPWSRLPKDDTLRAFRGTDVDLFLVTGDPNEALRAIRALHARLEAALEAALPPARGEGDEGDDEAVQDRMALHNMMPRHIRMRHQGGGERPRVRVMRTQQAITFFMPRPFRTVQVILRLYCSLEHVLLGFDVDACCFGFDGRRVVALPRALRAVRRGYNLVDPTRQSLTYEARLLKYARRGFAVGLPISVDLPRVLDRVRRRIEAAVALAADATPALAGLELLVGMFAAASAGDSALMRRLGVRRSDYAADQSIAAAEKRVRACRGDQTASVPFALGEDLEGVLFGQEAVARPTRPWNGPCVARAAVPPTVAFQVSTPHCQDRVDAPHLFTGAFHPSTAAWAEEDS